MHRPVRRTLQPVKSQVLHAQAAHSDVSGGKEVDSGCEACAHHGKLQAGHRPPLLSLPQKKWELWRCTAGRTDGTSFLRHLQCRRQHALDVQRRYTQKRCRDGMKLAWPTLYD